VYWVDLLIVGAVAWMTFRAFATGLIREVVTFAALIAGIFVAGAFYRDLSADIAFLIEDERTRNFASFLALLVGVVVLGQLLALVLKHAASLLMLGPFDHLGGAAFGFVKAIVLVQILLLAVAVFPPSAGFAAAVDQSTLAPYFLNEVPSAELALPSEFQHALEQLRDLRSAAAVIANGHGP
jgi:membrane protein required for colicin V production